MSKSARPSEIEMRRLVFAKYLLRKAAEQATLASPLNASAVLSAQDAVESVLIVTAQCYGVDPNKCRFLDFWDALGAKGVALPLKEGMRNLNSRRVAIKHTGAFPSTLDVARCVSDAQAFFDESVEVAFGIRSSDVTLASLVRFDSVRGRLLDAQRLCDEGLFVESIEGSAIAFADLLDSYVASRRLHPWDMPYRFSQVSKFDTGSKLIGGATSRDAALRNLTRYVDSVTKSIGSMSDAMRVMALGLDYDSYETFRQLTPHVAHYADGRYQCYWRKEDMESVADGGGCARWCLEFATECGIALSSRSVPEPKQINLDRDGLGGGAFHTDDDVTSAPARSSITVSSEGVVGALLEATGWGMHDASYAAVAGLLHIHYHGGHISEMLEHAQMLCGGDEGLCLPALVVSQEELDGAGDSVPGGGFFDAFPRQFGRPVPEDPEGRASLIAEVRAHVLKDSGEGAEKWEKLLASAREDGSIWNCTRVG